MVEHSILQSCLVWVRVLPPLQKCFGGEVANTVVCKTTIQGFESLPELKVYKEY